MTQTKWLMVALTAIAMLFSTETAAQTPRQILDKTATIVTSGGVQANFVVTNYKKQTAVGRSSGTFYVSGRRFKIVSAAGNSWFDGKTLWSLMEGSDEAYVSTPTKKELQSLNPYSFIHLYKSCYTISSTSTTYMGRACHEVKLKAQKQGMDINEVLITIDKSTYLPHCVRFRPSGGEWVRVQVSGVKTGQKWSDNFFRFDGKAHSGVRVVDLR
ncbi:MAG: hypothetical protein KIG47_04415 [Prevotellamassilia sp.]|nr:hypothetical protein [Prevotellamassilia sp.]